MQISKIFNSSKAPLVIKTLAQDKGSEAALGKVVEEHLEAARTYFDNPEAPPPDPNNSEYRAFALPILDAFLETTDPTFKPSPKGTNPSSEHADWIIKVYADRAADDKAIKSEDLQKIHTEIAHFQKAKVNLAAQGKPDKLSDYESYDNFRKVMRSLLSKNEEYRVLEEAPKHVRANTSVLYDGDEGQILVPHTHEASKYFGSENWCISYENTDHPFNETYNPKSSCLMYIPKKSQLKTEDDSIISGKVAVVKGEIYNEADDVEGKLPDYILPLRETALRSADKGKAAYIEMFGDKYPVFTLNEEQEPGEEPTPEEPDWSHLEHLPEEQQDLLKDLKNRTLGAYRNHFQKYPSLTKNKKFVLAAVQQNGLALQFAHPDLTKDSDIVLAAVRQHGKALEFAHEDLKNNEAIVFEAVRQNGLALQFAHPDLTKDPDIVLAAVQQNGWALGYAHEDRKKDKDIVLEAVRQNGGALEFADESLFEKTDFVEGLLDIAEQGDKDQKFEILKRLHRAPAFFGHMSADINALRSRLQDYSIEQNNTAELEVPDELLLGDGDPRQSDSAPV